MKGGGSEIRRIRKMDKLHFGYLKNLQGII